LPLSRSDRNLDEMGDLDDERLSQIAASNNAEWCASVWRSHGLTVERGEGLWFCRSETPRFYPNVVTVDPSSDPVKQARFIRELSESADFEFSVKDNFARLPLAAAGFARAFSAFWLSRDIESPHDAEPQRDWRAVSRDQLAFWETAWAGNAPDARRIFRTSLLEDSRVAVLARTDGEGRIIAGAITFEEGGVAGLTNVFGAAKGLFTAVGRTLSCRSIVAYEPGVPVEESMRRGFRSRGPLTVWTRTMGSGASPS
jgi:hypothetical protein